MGPQDKGSKPKRRRIFGKPRPAAAAAAGKAAEAPSQTKPQDADAARLQKELLSSRQAKASLQAKLADQAQKHESQLMGMALRGAPLLCLSLPTGSRALPRSLRRPFRVCIY